MAGEAVVSASPHAHLRVRRDMRWLAAGVLAVALGGLGTWFLFTSAADSRPALKLTRTVFRGEALQASDLTVVPIGRAVDVAAVPGERLNAVVGQTVSADLVKGSLLVEGSVGAPELAAGLARVGLKLEAGRLPSTPMVPGAHVQVVVLPPANGETASEPMPSMDATLSAAPATTPDGSYVVDLNVPVAQAEQVARFGALKQVALIRRSES